MDFPDHFIQWAFKKQKAFAVYRLPHQKQWQALAADDACYLNSYPKSFKVSGFLIHPFSLVNQPLIFIPEQFHPEKVSGNSASGFDKIFLPEFTEASFPVQNKDSYLQQTKEIINQIHSDIPLEKVVYSRIVKEKLKGAFDLTRFLLTMSAVYPEAFVYGFYSRRSGLWVGATPELFLNLNEQILQTQALAGTIKPSENTEWRTKETFEQKLVVDYILDLFKQFDIHLTEDPKTEAVAAGELLHLSTMFSAKADKVISWDLISALHPTPAVCGLPKAKAMECIMKYEKHQREYYTGFLGPTDWPRQAHFFVNLRCGQVVKDHILLYVGGGLTKDSEPEKEWLETKWKAQTLIHVLKKMPNFDT